MFDLRFGIAVEILVKLRYQKAVSHEKHYCRMRMHEIKDKFGMYEGWNFNSGNYLFTTDTK